MFITAETGLYLAEENLRLALAEPEESVAYRKYVASLRRLVRFWKRRVSDRKTVQKKERTV